MRNAKLLLERLTELYPPPAPAHHNITVDDGNFVVTLMFGDGVYPFMLTEDEDLDEPVEEMVRQFRELMDPVVRHGKGTWPVGSVSNGKS